MSKELYDIEIDGLPVEQADRFIRDILGISAESVEYSHFWSFENGDFEYSDDISLSNYLADGNSFTLRAEIARLDREYKNAVVLVSHGEGIAVTVSIEETDFDESYIPSLTEWLEKLRDEKIITSAVINYDAAAEPLVNL